MPEGDAKRIREYLCQLVEHARTNGEPRISVAAGEIRDAMGLSHSDAIIDICQVLKTQILREEARVEFLCKAGPKEGVRTVFLFKILEAGRVAQGTSPVARNHAKCGMYFLEKAVLSVLRDAFPKYVGPAEISWCTKIFGENLKIDGKEKVTSHSIAEGILAKLYLDGRLDYKYRAGWRLKSGETRN